MWGPWSGQNRVNGCCQRQQVRCVLKPRRCPDVKWAFHVRCISWTVPRSDQWRHIYLKNIGSCVQTWAVTRPHSCVVFPKRRKIILRFWNYPLVEEFLRNEPLYKNHHAFTIPLLSTLTSPTCKLSFANLTSKEICLFRYCFRSLPDLQVVFVSKHNCLLLKS